MERVGVERLLAQAGVDSRRLRHALALVSDGQWWTLADVVRQSATSRRTVESLVRELPLEHEGDRFRMRLVDTPGYQDLLAVAPPPEDPVAHLVPHYGHVLDRLTDLIAKAPRARHVLDHVSATPETVLRRALLLGARFWLPGARLLCVGDHDLTSLAVKLVHPETDVTVVDVDERILAYIDDQGLGVRTRWADLRLGLPPSAREHDLAVTDPPYTPEGTGLFVARALEGLKDDGRVLLAYGASERTPMLALKVQQELSQLNLVYEAVHPDFNRYFGAEAIGSSADLYILRPTTKTRPAVRTRLSRLTTAIYTQGPQSVESTAETSTASAALAALAGFEPDLLVGDWPKDLTPPRVKLSTWLAKPYAAAPSRVAVAVPPGLESALPRLLLATRASHVRVLLSGAVPPLPRPLSTVYDLRPADGVLDAVRLPQPTDEAASVLRRILDNGHAKLANTWREALIAVARSQGTTLTKNDARTLIRQTAPWSDDLTPLETPVHHLTALPPAITTTITALTTTL
ncbi:bis-aminopropyl spermidine synthase family protein [Nonomuraea aridisoli]|uniref:Putative methyltransferase n=1 Tax=Nonomuraea aridisoli TaxID=2070368 RepID=A0A2W2DUY0_9ACTN|nr:bis-aminopropyl spermidine synthase family protein [Nonomuraea aridisoli]PZG15662.1 putative methyltransferase [Nonomuraea aridisoli]